MKCEACGYCSNETQDKSGFIEISVKSILIISTGNKETAIKFYSCPKCKILRLE
jgi:hypothetical protein